MQKECYAWKARLRPGKLEEYKKRHAEIWPEMIDVLREAGIENYTIFESDNELFGYYECEKGGAHAAAVQANSAVVARWNAYMEDVMEMTPDAKTGAQPRLEAVWHLD